MGLSPFARPALRNELRRTNSGGQAGRQTDWYGKGSRADAGGRKSSEKLCKFLVSMTLRKSYGIIRFEAGKATHVETQTQRTWQYSDLPEQVRGDPAALQQGGRSC